MSYVLLTGDFHIFYPDPPVNAWKQGPEPDGDTIRFRPDSPDLVHRLRRPGQPAPNFNARGMIAVRFEGVDALETHFEGGHQPMDLALGARDAMLARAGFGAITYGDVPHDDKVRAVQNHPVRGYVLTNGLDGNGRLIAFVYFSAAPQPDRSEVMLEAPQMLASENAVSLQTGTSYASFYFTLPEPLTMVLATQARAAATAGVGLHARNDSRAGVPFAVTGIDALADLVIWPKLFRRLRSYFRDGATDLLFFPEWLRQDPKDRNDRFLLPGRRDMHFHNIVEVLDAQTMCLLHDPADLTIIPDDFVMPDTSLTRMGVFA